MISRQVQRVAAGEISREPVTVNAVALLIAGHETTANMIALSPLTLLQNPDQAARIRDTDDPRLVANAVEDEGIGDQIGPQVVGSRPADHATGGYVDDGGQIGGAR